MYLLVLIEFDSLFLLAFLLFTYRKHFYGMRSENVRSLMHKKKSFVLLLDLVGSIFESANLVHLVLCS